MMKHTFQKCLSFCRHPHTLAGLWVLIGILSYVIKHSKTNNFLIFRGVFWHTWEQTSLYALYPAEYFDSNHYGPLFSLIIAPFAILPVGVGMFLWHVALAVLLYDAVRRLQLPHPAFTFLIWFCAHDLLSALFMSQFNVAIAAMIIGAYICVREEKDVWAALWIVIGTFVKLYGIVGVAFFLFSRHKARFVLWLCVWSAVAFVLPMLISSPAYIVGQYVEWAQSLTEKGDSNMFSMYQNVSLLGIVRKVSGCATYSDVTIILPAMLLLGLPCLRFSQHKYRGFQQSLLAALLMSVVLFSTGSETSGYIIASLGIALWYTAMPEKRGRWDMALLIFALVLGSFGSSDLVPRFIRVEYIRPFALKVLPASIIWFKLCYELLRYDYRPTIKESAVSQ